MNCISKLARSINGKEAMLKNGKDVFKHKDDINVMLFCVDMLCGDDDRVSGDRINLILNHAERCINENFDAKDFFNKIEEED